MKKTGSKTVKKQPAGAEKKGRGKGRPFEKNDPATGKRDERINRKGPPRTSITLRQYILDMFEEEGKNERTGESYTILRAMLLRMALEGNSSDRQELLNRGFGKVPDEIIFSSDDLKKILDHLPTDMIDRIVNGESLGDVLVSWITNSSHGKASQDTKGA